MARMITQSRAALGLPTLEPAEVATQARSFATIIEGEVPDTYLESAYVRAMRDKESSYPLSAPEIVQAYRAITADETAAPPIPRDRNLLPGNVCSRCFGQGIEQILVDGYKQGRRCDHIGG
jgi:hypothetical protein